MQKVCLIWSFCSVKRPNFPTCNESRSWQRADGICWIFCRTNFCGRPPPSTTCWPLAFSGWSGSTSDWQLSTLCPFWCSQSPQTTSREKFTCADTRKNIKICRKVRPRLPRYWEKKRAMSRLNKCCASFSESYLTTISTRDHYYQLISNEPNTPTPLYYQFSI